VFRLQVARFKKAGYSLTEHLSLAEMQQLHLLAEDSNYGASHL
jgi:hypothetical protein